MDGAQQMDIVSDQLLVCCLCKRLLRDAVQLACLHNCCRQCFSIAASNGGRQEVACGSCGTNTSLGIEQPNHFVDRQAQIYTSIAEAGMCGLCKKNGDAEKPALMWCITCRHSLCEDCVTGHGQFNRQHDTVSHDELDSLQPASLLPPPTACPIHKKPLDVACLNCEQIKCISCWAKCLDQSHKMLVAGSKSFDKYVEEFISRIRSLETQSLRKSEILEKPKRMIRDMKEARKFHLAKIRQRKRLIVDAVEAAYEEIESATKNAYDELQAEGDAAFAAADRIASNLSDARSYIKRLVESDDKFEIIQQQKIVQERMTFLLAEVLAWSEKLASMSRALSVDQLLPDDLENVIRQWIGVPVSSLAFDAASASVQLPVQCCDVALTQDGRLLLAAGQHGLLEFSSCSTQELSRWLPPKQNDGQDDSAQAVAVLSDGRIAASVKYAQLVVLLRRCEAVGGSSQEEAATAAWTEERRLEQLPWPPRWLAAHGDVLAVTEYRLDEQPNRWVSGRRLQLLSLSSGRRLGGERLREYDIFSLAVSARAVVTGSFRQTQVDGGRRAAQVLDANILADSDKRLWRYGLNSSDEEILAGVCTDSAGSCLYAAVWRHDLSSGRVFALSLADGCELRHVALRFSSDSPQQPQLLPWRLSLSDRASEQQQAGSRSMSSLQLAVLSRDSSKQWRTVTVHSSSCQQ